MKQERSKNAKDKKPSKQGIIVDGKQSTCANLSILDCDQYKIFPLL